LVSHVGKSYKKNVCDIQKRHHTERINALPLFGRNFNAAIGAQQVGDDLTLVDACGNEGRNRRAARMIHWILEGGLSSVE